MLIPDFSLQNIIPQHRDAGEAFQAFISDLLKRELPSLEEFAALGKDGGIDFCQNNGTRLLVGECKFMDGGNIDTALREWKKVEVKLREHLSSPQGPTSGQSQYQPWYNHNPAISAYYFCINVTLTNLNQINLLEGTIARDFVKLSDDFPHLNHLRTMQVVVIHWGRLKERLEAHPFVYFSWFRNSYITGLEQVDAPSQLVGFRAYLSNDKLPYYSIEHHKTINPTTLSDAPPGENDLLNLLEVGNKPGVIITGSGGVGKSRLALQLARLAKERDWPVFRVRRIGSDTIERLARGIGTASPTLLIFDYLETQDDFAQIVEEIVQINELSGCRLRFVASCRASYYKASIKQRVNHLEVNLAYENAWLEGYRHAAVRHILNTTGIDADADHERVCKGIPVLAVFMAYLRDRRHEDELRELIRIEDFGKWVVKRLDTAFGRSAGRDIATLVSLFPLPKEKVDLLDRERFERLFTILADDGWIEEREWDELNDGPVWGTVHDVLADGVMLAHLEQVEQTSSLFVTDLLRTSAKMGLLRSALTSLQRIVFEPPLGRVMWLELFSAQFVENPGSWQEARETLLQFAGLGPQQRINLLSRSPDIWEGAEGEVQVQNSLGWIARCVVRDEVSLSNHEEKILREWLSKAAIHLTRSNLSPNLGGSPLS